MAQEYSMPSSNKTPFLMEYVRASNITGKANIISGLTATKLLTKDESGSIIILDRAAGSVITLPEPELGLTYTFLVDVPVTSNSYKIITNTALVLFSGQYVGVDIGAGWTMLTLPANGTTHRALTLNGGTTGGLAGTQIKVTCINATKWHVEGLINADAIASAFTAS